MRLRRADPHTLAGACALDAVDDRDRAAFERHIQACEACRQEVASLREAGTQLAAVTATMPPPALRERVLAEAARARQSPPVITGGEGIPSGRPGPLLRAAPRFAVAIAGACMLIALVMGGFVVSSQHRLSQARAHNRAITAVLNAPDVAMMTTRARTGGTATVVMSRAEHALVLTTAHLPALPGSERYEVWLMGPAGTRVRPAGMLPAPRRGMTAPMVVSGLAAGDRMGLTVEPSGGARHPTSAPVLMVNLPS